MVFFFFFLALRCFLNSVSESFCSFNFRTWISFFFFGGAEFARL